MRAVDVALAEYWLTPTTPENAPRCTSAPPACTPEAARSWASVAPLQVSMLPFTSTAGLPVLLTSTQLVAELALFCDSLACTVVQIVVGSRLAPVAPAYW